jgi:SAM-dependent methyltransferase
VLGEHAQRAARTYGAAADHFTLAPLNFWDRLGAATVARLPLATGDRVLDLCCGAGASAIPAARAVGAAGRVVGVDVAEPLLELARARAAREGLANAEFRRGDATGTGLADGSFDAVAITTWGPGLFEPATSVFWTAVGEIEPSLVKAYHPWDKLTSPAALAGLFTRAGASEPAVTDVPGQHRLDRPEDFWDVVLGSGYRATVDALSPQQRGRLHDRLLGELRSAALTYIRTDAVFGTARKPV